MRSFVSKHGAVDALLSAVVGELAPDEDGIGMLGSQDNLLAGSDKESADPAIAVVMRAVVPLVEPETVSISILREPPDRR